MNIPYEILVEGYFTEQELILNWTSNMMERNQETEYLIEKTWIARQADARKNNQLLYSGNLCRLVNWIEYDGILKISVGQTNYKELVGTNICHPEVATKYGLEYLSNGIAVCSVLVTVDRRLIVQQRNHYVYEHPDKYHLCGGNLEPIENMGCLNPFLTMKKELQEELLIESKYIADMHCLGFVRDSFTLKPEIIFETLLNIPSDYMEQGTGPEHKQLLLLNESPSELLEFLVSNISQFVPVGLACLVIYSKRKFGEQWYKDFLASIDNTQSVRSN